MPDRIGQEKDKKRTKTLLTIAGVLIGLNIVLFLLVPTQRNVSYDGEATVYSAADERFEETCTVKIKGYVTQSVLLTDTFQAEFYISDVPGMTEDMRLFLQRKDGRWKRIPDSRKQIPRADLERRARLRARSAEGAGL